MILPDSGRSYLSKIYNDAWMTEYGFLERSGERTVGAVLRRGRRQDERRERDEAEHRGIPRGGRMDVGHDQPDVGQRARLMGDRRSVTGARTVRVATTIVRWPT